jgi:hypothetical protein
MVFVAPTVCVDGIDSRPAMAEVDTVDDVDDVSTGAGGTAADALPSPQGGVLGASLSAGLLALAASRR